MRLVCRELSGFDIALLGVIQLYIGTWMCLACARSARRIFKILKVQP